MDEPLSHWLRLREQADHASRFESLTRMIASAMPLGGPVRVLDLATGTGSNIRYLSDHLRGRQEWLAIDRSAGLLDALGARMSSWAEARGYNVRTDADGSLSTGPRLECHVATRQRDLGTLDDPLLFAGRHLVTASALLDLVSVPWLRALARHCREERAAMLFTITYNGRFSCLPAEAEDEMVRALMNRHQKTDKGLGGPAAGPEAVAAAEQIFAEAGYHVQRAGSDWTLGPADADVQRLLIDGWVQAATEMAPDQASTIADWGSRRLAHVAAGRSRLVVGHDDLAALPRE